MYDLHFFVTYILLFYYQNTLIISIINKINYTILNIHIVYIIKYVFYKR